jgi:hypothetical protein
LGNISQETREKLPNLDGKNFLAILFKTWIIKIKNLPPGTCQIIFS